MIIMTTHISKICVTATPSTHPRPPLTLSKFLMRFQNLFQVGQNTELKHGSIISNELLPILFATPTSILVQVSTIPHKIC